MKTWDQVVESAAEFISFLEKGNFYNTKFSTEKDYKIIFDANLGIDYATNDSFDDFDEWETVTDTPDIFPESFEWNDRIKYKLKQKKYFGFENQEFNGAKEKWITSEACLIVELMYRDIGIIFQCYANDYFPTIWKEILEIYLNSGFPCGWDGHLPEGKIVVFSNQ